MRTSNAADERRLSIGVVIHGPEVVDTGFALRAMEWLEGHGDVVAVLGGTMGRVAVIDAGLADRIDISRRRTPSQSVQDLQHSDLTVLLNHAKSRETGIVFGAIVAGRARPANPLIQADSGGRFVAALSNPSDLSNAIAEGLASHFGFEILDACVTDDNMRQEGDAIVRRMSGVLPGERISVNGTVIGTATDTCVEIVARNGRIVGARGIDLKMHGLEKLPHVDLRSAILRSGSVRRTAGMLKPRLGSMRTSRNGRFAIIDHAAEDSFELASDASFVITIGDDTTAIAGDVLSRLGIPVLGIVDGDLDGICSGLVLPEGSVIVRVRAGNDDIIGKAIKSISENRRPASLDEALDMVREAAGDRIISVIRCDGR
ncbi:MAG TPA: DUF2117 domain-containing protein [Methanothrix sp.]|nr:DUF2117 domain-containing protein [Methanothrix sp.]HOK58956.1 DUF2117 domain-containing protein [Methanothrix sp.]HOL44239.1 DUF2117 domain-containing protein [Methanothrix sp.]HPO89217.1 DUF2117 domain-containing protein [Methanothrix sp.]